MKNSNFTAYTNEQDSVPRATTGTGTITDVNNNRKIVGVGTLFTQEAKEGDWIYMKTQSATTGRFRKIINIVNDLELTIESPFGGAIAASAYDITPASKFISVSIFPVTAVANIDGIAAPANEQIHFEKGRNWKNAAGNFVDPIDIDSTVNISTVNVSTLN